MVFRGLCMSGIPLVEYCCTTAQSVCSFVYSSRIMKTGPCFSSVTLSWTAKSIPMIGGEIWRPSYSFGGVWLTVDGASTFLGRFPTAAWAQIIWLLWRLSLGGRAPQNTRREMLPVSNRLILRMQCVSGEQTGQKPSSAANRNTVCVMNKISEHQSSM